MDNQTMNKIKDEFQRKGFVTIPDFFDPQEIQDLKKAVHRLIENMDPSDHTSCRVFTFDEMDTDLTSNDKIRFFFEKDAVNEKRELIVDRHDSLNKLGYAMHWLEPTFKKITFSPKVQNLVRQLGFVKPRVVQSMYIFKNPRIGGVVLPHQDATYLSAVPKKSGDRPKEIGVWFPLEDATEENGCLWFIPGSHMTGLHRQSVPTENGKFEYTAPLPDYDEKSWVSAPAKKGSVVLIDGLVVHKSAHNSSKYPRPIYTFHIYDAETCDWDPKSWMQMGPGNPFPPLFTN